LTKFGFFSQSNLLSIQKTRTKFPTLFLTVLLVEIVACSEKPVVEIVLIQNVKIVDGTGEPAIIPSLRIKGDKIEAIGNLEAINDRDFDNREAAEYTLPN